MVAERVRAPGPDTPFHVRMLLAIRTQRHWTQQDLAMQLGVSVSTIAAWESGRREPHVVWLRTLRVLLEEPLAPDAGMAE
jgi:putative transcriptional regulator